MASTRPHIYADGSVSTRWMVTDHAAGSTYACLDCGYSTTNIFALAGHNRGHDVLPEEPRRKTA